MTEEIETLQPWKVLSQLAETGTPEAVQEFFDQLAAGEVPLAVSRLDDKEQEHVLDLLPPDQAADIIDQLPGFQAVEIIERLQPETAAAILDELPSNEQADLLGDLDEANAKAILAKMEPAEAADARSLTKYADDVAGGLMVTEYLRYTENQTVGDVIRDMRKRADEYRDYEVQYAYVCDPNRKLTGVLRMRDLLLAAENQRVADLMIRDPISLADDTPLEDLMDFFTKYQWIGVPVVRGDGELVGVIHKEAVDEAWRERHESAYLKSQGIIGGDETRTMPLLRRSRRRLSWLVINIGLNVIAASVIAIFQDTLSAVIALAVFLPIISDMSGNSGTQAVAVSVRELTMGLVRPQELWRVWIKEVSVGLINGTILGLLIGAVAWLWQGNVYLGFVVAVALCINTVVAVSFGGLLPLVLRRMNVDPAIASGPILTTITDMFGFFLVLGIATLMLSYLM